MGEGHQEAGIPRERLLQSSWQDIRASPKEVSGGNESLNYDLLKESMNGFCDLTKHTHSYTFMGSDDFLLGRRHSIKDRKSLHIPQKEGSDTTEGNGVEHFPTPRSPWSALGVTPAHL